jgi:DNA invertase Pin-like site-specific DNA recombinase
MANNSRAYSYLRFSSPEQMKGDSFRRQMELTRKYAKDNHLDLDESLTFQDLGVSAYRGLNIREGALKAFVDAVEGGVIPAGSFLLVESLDRLSRRKVHDAFIQFNNILSKGVNIVTLQDGKVYTKDSVNDNFGDLMISLATMFRAHEESQTKALRLKASWKNKRSQAREGGKRLTGLAPAWLTVGDEAEAEGFKVIDERVKVINRIFSMSLDGLGKGVISTTFNREGVPTFGKSTRWHRSYIQKILDNEAVVGRFQPMRITHVDGRRKRVPDGEIIEGYFPSIIEIETFLRARDMRRANRIGGGRKGKRFSNLFTGLATCGACGSPMHYVSKGSGSRGGTYLACSGARAGLGCDHPSWRYLAVQSVLIQGLNEVDFRELYPAVYQSVSAKLRELEDSNRVKAEELERITKQIDNVVDIIVDNPTSKAMQAKLVTLEETKGRLEDDIRGTEDELSKKRDNISHGSEGLEEALERLLKAEERGEEVELMTLRSRLHQLLKRCIKSIKMFPAMGAQEPIIGVNLHGIIEVVFNDIDNHFRRFYFEKGQRNAHGYAVVNGVERLHTSHIDIRWPPDGVIMMGGFLGPFILGLDGK